MMRYLLFIFPILLLTIFISTAYAIENVILFDDFEDGEIDPDKWIFNPNGIGGSVTEHDGYLDWNGYGSTPYQAVRTSIDLLRDELNITVDVNPVWVAPNKNVGFWLGQVDGYSTGYNEYYGHGYFLMFNSTSSYVEIHKFSGDLGGWVIGTIYGVPMNTWHPIEVTKSGNTIQFFIHIDGDKQLIATDSKFSLEALHFSTGRMWNETRNGEDGHVLYDNLMAIQGSIGVLSITILPDTTVFSKGDTLWFSVDISNNADTTVVFEAWTSCETPFGHYLSPLLGPLPMVLGPGGEMFFYVYRQEIPANAPVGGPYLYCGNVGTYPDDIITEDCFEFYIVPPVQ